MGGTSSERKNRIVGDILQKGVERKTISDNYLANGFVFFPGEAETARDSGCSSGKWKPAWYIRFR